MKMGARSAALVVLALSAAIGLAAAQQETKATRYKGFTYASNVLGYVNMTLDLCDIKAAIDSGNMTAAMELYVSGKNSKRTTVSTRTFQGFAVHNGGSEPLYVALTMGRNASWLDDMILAAFAAGNAPLVVGLIQVATVKYMMHEIDEGSGKIGVYLSDMETLGALISDDSGAPHNVDEGFALWAGGISGGACGLTPSTWPDLLGDAMDTTFVGATPIGNAMTLAWNDLQGYARNGSVDQTAYNYTRGMVMRLMTLTGLQGVSLAAYQAELAASCKRPAADVAAAKAAITTHWAYLKGLLASRLEMSRVDALGRALTRSSVKFADVRDAVKSCISGMGRRMAEIGEPVFEKVNADWKCSSSYKPKRK